MIKKYIAGVVMAPVLALSMASAVFAQTPTTTAPAPTSTPAPTTATPVMPKGKVDVACAASAVDKREGAIIAAFNTFSASASSALQARRSALKAAWSNPDPKAMKQGIQEAWKTFKNAAKQAHMTLKAARKSAWDQFKTDRKACGSSMAEPGGGLGSEESL